MSVTLPTDLEFAPWSKIARLNRDIVVTEKIDGTNAAIIIREDGQVHAQSRKRFIAPGQDNHGFATWVEANEGYLVNTLGVGTHYGEWWGSGIQSGYGLPQGKKVFSLFNVKRWGEQAEDFRRHDIGLDVVPVLYEGPFSQDEILMSQAVLRLNGSLASENYGVSFMKPEGVIIYHTAANLMFKVTLENDAAPKSLVQAGANA